MGGMMRLEDMVERKNEARILTLDIETSPIIAYTWGPKWETNIIEFIQHTSILSYSAKWLDGKQETKGLIDYKGYKKNSLEDKKLIVDLHKLLDEADIVVTQNGVDFDIKLINARFMKYGLPPPSPYKQIDTKKEAKRQLRLPSYSLDDMGEYFGLGRKIKTEFDLWKRCIAGDKKAWDLMKKYNAQDVVLTETIYLKLRPFMKSHPNVTLYSEKSGCPACGSDNYHNRGYYTLTSGKYHRASCNDCGHWYKYGKPEPLENKKTKGTSI
jgi:DNA polymerase elongation subunit (family B)